MSRLAEAAARLSRLNRADVPRFIVGGTEFAIWHKVDDEASRALLMRLLAALREVGWYIRGGFAPPNRHRYPSLRRGRAWGAKGRLRLVAEGSGRRVSVEFYPDPNPSHPYPRHAFDKLAATPFWDRMELKRSLGRLRDVAASLGLEDATGPALRDGRDAAEWRVLTSGHYRGEVDAEGRAVMERHGDYYGCLHFDQDGVLLENGDVRCFYDYRGRLRRGRAYRDIGDGWILVADEVFYNINHRRLFASPVGAPRCDPRRARDSLTRALAEAVKAQAFERAIPMRDRLRESA